MRRNKQETCMCPFITALVSFHPCFSIFSYPRLTFPLCCPQSLQRPNLYICFSFYFSSSTLNRSCLSHMMCILYFHINLCPFFASFLSFLSSIHLLIICAKRQHAGDGVWAYMETTEEKWADILLLIAIRCIYWICAHTHFTFFRFREIRVVFILAERTDDVSVLSVVCWWV